MFTNLAIKSVFSYISDKLSFLPLLKIQTNVEETAFTYDDSLSDERFRQKYVKNDKDLNNYIHFIWTRSEILPFEMRTIQVQKWAKAYAKENNILDMPIGKVRLVKCNLDIRPISNSLLLLETFEEYAAIYLYDNFSTVFTVSVDDTDFEFIISGTIQDLTKYEKSEKKIKQYKEQFRCELIYPVVIIDDIGKLVSQINKQISIYVED